jgi:hypothetical protein
MTGAVVPGPWPGSGMRRRAPVPEVTVTPRLSNKVEQARVLLQLAEQWGIDLPMLESVARGEPPRPKPLIFAVPLLDENGWPVGEGPNPDA